MALSRRLTRVLVVAAGVLAALVLAPLWCDGEHRAMDGAAREAAPGKLAPLRDGVIHHQVSGPEAGPRVVLIHGVSGPMSGWDRVVPALESAGFRVLRYDHFGRGYSDRLDRDHDEALHDRALADLLDAVGWKGPVALVGSSMGAIVAAGFAVRHPERVAGVVLVGPAGFPIEVSLGAHLLQVPWLGEYAMRVVGDRTLAAHHRKYFVDLERGAAVQAAFEAQLEVEGTKRSILSTMRHMPVDDYHDGFRRLGAARVPVHIVWGRSDRTFPYSHLEEARRLMPRATVATIEDAAHLPHVEQPDAFARSVVPFLRGLHGEPEASPAAGPDAPRPPSPRLVLGGAPADPDPRQLFAYLIRNRAVVPGPGSFCEGRLDELPAADRTLGGLLASYLGHSANEPRAVLEIACGAPGADAAFTIPDSPACPADPAGASCRRCALVIQLDGISDDPSEFMIYGRLLFQYRPGRPLPAKSLFCTEAG